ncbi:hypothetical protein HPP92_019183 [Vanilla planifolia]|uniref:Fe2OG dioxygenase domain-containing protein n=1 Tax=Vanilla planifolia TaxID=51239 RepID=A0A835UN36_VANPL|nr:hypothetical protein HPP92_019183 [Vanilla planifolia]
MGTLGGIISDTQTELPVVDLRGLNQSKLHTKAWDIAQRELIRALQSYGGVELIYDQVEPEIRDGLLDRAVPELFAENVATDRPKPPPLPYHGVYMYREGFPYFSIQLANLNSLASVEEYANTIWPQGNPYFSNVVWNYAVYMQELIRMIHRMILEGLGLGHKYESFIKSLANSIRLSKYHDDISSNETKVALPPHKDPNYLSIIDQRKMDGLEVEGSDGKWLRVSPMPNSFIVLLGEAMMAWSNGRLKASNHRVQMDVSKERYVVIYGSLPSQSNDLVSSPMELTDKEHPTMYKPFKYYDYLKFRFSNEEDTHKDTLKAFCGA